MSSIIIKKCAKPPLQICHMNCDKPLHPKLDKYPMTQCCFQKHATTCILGKPGSGKSSYIYSMFKSKNALKKCFDKIYYICPASSIDSMSDNIFSKLPDDQVYNELDGEVLDEIIAKCENREDGDKICLIIDDMGSQIKRADVQVRLKKIAQNKRHMNIYQCFLLLQTWKSAPFEIRRLYDNIITFKVSPDEMESIMTEAIPQYKPVAREIQKIVFDNQPHSYLAINTGTGTLFKNWNQLIVNEE